MNRDGGSAQQFDTRRDLKSKRRADLRQTIEAAALKIRSRDPGKDPVDGQASVDGVDQPVPTTGTRTLGGRVTESERRRTRSSVQKAMEKVGYVPLDESAPTTRDRATSDRETLRTAVHTLQQRYPGRSAADFVKTAKDWDAGFKADPVGTREKILETYSTVSPENFRDHKPAEKVAGARGSVRRAMADHAAMSDLAPFQKEFGDKLPGVVAELVRHDGALVNDPVGASARLAANYGAPVTPRQQQAHEAKQQQEQARQQDAANVHKAIHLIIQHNVLPGLENEDVQHAVADTLASKGFQRTGDRLQDLRNAHAHVMAARAAPKQSNRGSKSIHGAPAARSPRGRDDRSAVRRSIDKARQGG